MLNWTGGHVHEKCSLILSTIILTSVVLKIAGNALCLKAEGAGPWGSYVPTIYTNSIYETHFKRRSHTAHMRVDQNYFGLVAVLTELGEGKHDTLALTLIESKQIV